MCTARCQLEFSCIYLSMTFYPDVCCCCNLMMLYGWRECVLSVLGTTNIHAWRECVVCVLGTIKHSRLAWMCGEYIWHHKTFILGVNVWWVYLAPQNIHDWRESVVNVLCTTKHHDWRDCAMSVFGTTKHSWLAWMCGECTWHHKTFVIGVNVWWVYLEPQNIPNAIVLTFGSKVVLYCITLQEPLIKNYNGRARQDQCGIRIL